jgi:hypothetical protein
MNNRTIVDDAGIRRMLHSWRSADLSGHHQSCYHKELWK